MLAETFNNIALSNISEETQILRQLNIDVEIDDIYDTFSTVMSVFNFISLQLINFDAMSSLNHCSFTDFLLDTFQTVSQQRTILLKRNFEFVLNLWITETDIMMNSYIALLKILQTMNNISKIKYLSKVLITLKHNTRAHFSLMKMRKKEISVIFEKLLTEHSAANALLTWLYWFDSLNLVKIILSAQEFMSKLHVDLAEFVDSSSELWHLHSWTTSIQSCLEDFAKYADSNNDFIFLLNIVYYKYYNLFCHCEAKSHIERVHAIAKDWFKFVKTSREITLKLQSLIQFDATQLFQNIIDALNESLNFRKLLCIEDQHYYVSEVMIMSRESSVYLNYEFQSWVSDLTSEQLEHRKEKITLSAAQRLNLEHYDKFLIHCILNIKKRTIRLLQLFSLL